jgi:hypothetical protein
MAGHSPYISMEHPAVGAVVCPYCHAPRSIPCTSTGKKAVVPGQRNGTHLARVRAYDRVTAAGPLDSRAVGDNEVIRSDNS